MDVVIDPFRPGILEKAGLCPSNVMLKINPSIIVARMTGFRRDGKYSQMAGHDINYIAVSGVLSMLGRAHEKPFAPGNIIGDFAGGGAVCFMGILLALLSRNTTGRGQVVEANMVDGSAFLATMPRLATKRLIWAGQRGTNMLDGGCPYYDTYETEDGGYMAVYVSQSILNNLLTVMFRGALEPQFFAALLNGLSLTPSDLPGPREDPTTWSQLRTLFTRKFKSKKRSEWEMIFDGTDACCTPVFSQRELEESGFDQRPLVTLRSTPGLALSAIASEEQYEAIRAAKGSGPGVEGDGWESEGLSPSAGGEDTLREWAGWRKNLQYEVFNGGLVLKQPSKL